MTMEEIRELRDKLEPLSYGIGGIQIKFPFGTDDLCLTAYPTTEENHRKMEVVLAPYREKFIRIDLYRTIDAGLCGQYLERIDFLTFKHTLIELLLAEIGALAQRLEGEPIYAFALAISPEHHNVDVWWNTPSNWASREHMYESKGYTLSRGVFPPTKYNGPDFQCTPLTIGSAVWDPVHQCLREQDQVASEFFELTGELGSFGELYERRFTAMAVQALRAVAPQLEHVRVTDDFIYYVEYYAGGDNLFLALETVPEEKMRSMFPETLVFQPHK